MYKKSITYTDYNGLERTEDFYFNLNQTELTMLDASVPGGFKKMVEDIIAAKDGNKIMTTFASIIKKAYGEKSPDGRYFDKSDEISRRFACTEAYNQFFLELVTNEESAVEFINGIIPPAPKTM